MINTLGWAFVGRKEDKMIKRITKLHGEIAWMPASQFHDMRFVILMTLLDSADASGLEALPYGSLKLLVSQADISWK